MCVYVMTAECLCRGMDAHIDAECVCYYMDVGMDVDCVCYSMNAIHCVR